MKVYLAGPMRGIPDFNRPAFIAGAEALRAKGHIVFSPSEHDEKQFGVNIGNDSGSIEQASKEHGFNLRTALAGDLAWICAEADAVVCLPNWSNSKGVTAERAVAAALGLVIDELAEFLTK